MPIFNGQDLSGWDTWLPSKGLNNDPQGVFKVANGELHILDIPGKENGKGKGGEQEFGYLASQQQYSDYRLRLEYQWGDKKFAPRHQQPRDSGLLYHVEAANRLWPTRLEMQIKEGETGDLWLLGGSNANTRVRNPSENPPVYQPTGMGHTTSNRGPNGYRQVVKSAQPERAGWKQVEVVVSGDEAAQIVNGVVTNRMSSIRGPGGAPLTRGRVLLQAEGAQVAYR
ncbi:MAG: 3-keto-disaccharide hydrolase, partial [Deinococcus sp.]